jgi:hypothetical protein
MRITSRDLVFIALGILGLTMPVAGQSVPAGPKDAGATSTVPFQVQFDIAAGMVYDDNIFWRPVGTDDTILRITPAIEARRQSAHVSFSSRYRLDSERYAEHSELNDPFAAQNADLDLFLRPDPRTTLALRGGYSRTHRPGELNTTTGLVLGRQLASVGGASTELSYRLGAVSAVQVGYGFDGTDTEMGPDSLEHAAHVRLTRDMNPKDQTYVAYRLQHWTFYPGNPILSQTAVAGWSRRLTPLATVTLEAGPRLTSGDVQPEVMVGIGGHVAKGTGVTLSYAHTQTAAVGVVGLVDTDRLLADFSYRSPAAWDVNFAGGLFRDIVAGFDRVVAYQVSADVRRAISSRVWLLTTARASFNTRRAGDVAPGDERIRQRSIAVSLQITPFGPRRPRSES